MDSKEKPFYFQRFWIRRFGANFPNLLWDDRRVCRLLNFPKHPLRPNAGAAILAIHHIMDNLGGLKRPAIRASIEAAGASSLYLPPYNPAFEAQGAPNR
jgi:hypothetical protein